MIHNPLRLGNQLPADMRLVVLVAVTTMVSSAPAYGHAQEAEPPTLRVGVFVTLGDLISSLDLTAWTHNARHEHYSKGHSATIGETLRVRSKRDVTIAIRLRDPYASNSHGDHPYVNRVDLIVGKVTGPVLDRSLATNPTSQVVKRFGPGDWRQHGEFLTMTYTLQYVTDDSYVRVRGTHTDQLEPYLHRRSGRALGAVRPLQSQGKHPQ